MKGRCKVERRGFAFPLGLFGLVILVVFLYSLHPVVSRDFWWHISTGRYIAEHGEVPSTDPFSFTRRGAPWTPHSWLPDLVVYLVWKGGGLPAVLVLPPLFFVLNVLLFLWWLSISNPAPDDERRTFIWKLSGASCLVFFFLPTCASWMLRPNVISITFTFLLVCLLEKCIADAGEAAGVPFSWRHLLAFFVYFVVWANCHAGVVAGLVVVGAYAAAATLEHGWKAALGWWKLLGLCCAAVFCHVLGPLAVYGYVYRHTVSVYCKYVIAEWQSPSFYKWKHYAVMVVASGVLPVLARRMPPLRLYALHMFWLLNFLYSIRHMPFFSLFAAPAMTYPVASLLGQGVPLLRRRLGLEQAASPAGDDGAGPGVAGRTWLLLERMVLEEGKGRIGAACLLVVLLAFSCVASPALARRLCGGRLVTAGIVPGPRVLGALQEAARQGRVRLLNTYALGGYLIWKVPSVPVFVDGRTLVYDKEVIHDYRRVNGIVTRDLSDEELVVTGKASETGEAGADRREKRDWIEVLERWRITHMLLLKSTIGGRAYRFMGFRVVAEDEAAVLYEVDPLRLRELERFRPSMESEPAKDASADG